MRPTLRASHLSVGGIIAAASGIVGSQSAVVAYGGAMLCGVALSRALTRLSVARARTAGFEMLWKSNDSMQRVTRGHEVILHAELRNRDTLPTRFRNLSVSHSPALEVRCHPRDGEVPARGTLSITLRVRAHRVGLHGLHNITLQTIRAPGLYTVPLSFTNPFVFEVLPKPVRLGLAGAAGGRARSHSPSARAGRQRGDGLEIRELREHQPGDPYKRIAWKASARRGRLLTIEKEQESSDVVWLVIDTSVDSCSGAPGYSVLDSTIDQAVATIEGHLNRGDQVGLALVGTRTLAKIDPGRGPKHLARLISALTLDTHTADADRSDWDEADVARRALEHLKSLDARASQLRSFEYEKLAHLAREVAAQAPAKPKAPWSPSATDRSLRQYLLAFGIQPPPRGSSDRHHSELQIARLLADIQTRRPRTTLVHLYAKAPNFETPKRLLQILARIPKKRTEVRFHPLLENTGMPTTTSALDPKSALVRDALNQRQRIANENGLRQLARLGIRTAQPRAKLRAFLAQTTSLPSEEPRD